MSRRSVLVARGAEAHGRAVAHDLARAGYGLALTYWSGHEGALALRDELVAGGARVVLARVDVAGDGAGHVAANRALEGLGRVDALVLLPPAPAAPSAATGRPAWEAALAAAAIGPALFLRAVLAAIPALELVTVVAPADGDDAIAAAAAGALRGWAGAAARELATAGVKVLLVADAAEVRAALGADGS